MRFANLSLPKTLISDRALVVSGISSLALRLGGLAASFELGVILARALGPAEFGIYGLVIAVSALTMNFALLGIPQLAVREIAAKSGEGAWADIGSLDKSFLLATTSASAVLSVLSTRLHRLARLGKPYSKNAATFPRHVQ